MADALVPVRRRGARTGALGTGYRRRVSHLKRRRAEQDAFARRLLESQEAERKRIAGELHDGIGQTLVVIRNRARLGLREGIDPLRQIAEIQSAAGEGIEEVRKVAYGLRPYQLDRLGLRRALVAVVEQTAASSGIAIEAEIGEVDGAFRKDDEINVYRIVQEGLSNLARHAGAGTRPRRGRDRTAKVVAITIEDDGAGFDASAVAAGGGGLGLEWDRGTGQDPRGQEHRPLHARQGDDGERDPSRGADRVTGDRIRIVVADDHPTFRRGLRELLDLEEDFEVVVECGDGEAALAAIERERPDVALLDVDMPGKDGFAVLRALRERGLTTLSSS